MKSSYKTVAIKADDILLLERDVDGKFYAVGRGSCAGDILKTICDREGIELTIEEFAGDALYRLLAK